MWGDIFWLSKVGNHLTTICEIDFILEGIFFFLKWKFVAHFYFLDRIYRMGQDKEFFVSPGAENAETRRQRSDVGCQRSEVGGQRSEVGGQRSEVGGQRSDVRGQRGFMR